MSGIKLKLNMSGITRTPSMASAGAPPTPAPTSAVTPGGSKTLSKLLKFKAPSQPPTPAPEDLPKPKKTKAGRTTKPSAKLVDSKKRPKEDSDSDNEGSTIAVVQPQKKKIKLSVGGSKLNTPISAAPKTPNFILKAKVKGKPPKRPAGEGYDSEASDREEDPFIEEEFVLRMFPGEDCDYLRNAIAEKKIGLAKNMGGADISMKFFHAEGRRAAITIRGRCYAATLVDLPCVIEGMKSWDRRGWWKSADICQMLWVFAPIKAEDEAKTIELPKIVDPVTFQYPHGLTPPMHFARKRRFRKRISRTAIEAMEDAVEKLLAEDAKATSTNWQWIDPDASRQGSLAFSPGDSEDQEVYSGEEDAEGEADDTGYFNGVHGNGIPPVPFDDNMGDLEAEMEAAFEEDSLAAATPSSAPAVTPSMLNGGDTPMIEEAVEEEEDSGDESLEDDDDDDGTGAPVEFDEEQKARLAYIQSVKEDIADMEKQIELKAHDLNTTTNPILRKRLDENIRKMKAELTLKISSLPAENNDED